LHNLEIALRIFRIWKLRANLEIVHSAISVACTLEPRLLFEFPSCIKVRNVRKELLQLRHHYQHWACSGKFTNSEKLPSPWSGYGCRETPDLWSAPVQRLHQLREFSTLFLLSAQMLSSHYSVTFTNCDRAISYCTSQDWLCNLEIGMQFPDSKNVHRNLKIAQICRLDCLHLQCKYPSPSYMLAIYSYPLKQENVKSG